MKLQDGLDLKKFICVTTALYVHQTSLGHLSYHLTISRNQVNLSSSAKSIRLLQSCFPAGYSLTGERESAPKIEPWGTPVSMSKNAEDFTVLTTLLGPMCLSTLNNDVCHSNKSKSILKICLLFPVCLVN